VKVEERLVERAASLAGGAVLLAALWRAWLGDAVFGIPLLIAGVLLFRLHELRKMTRDDLLNDARTVLRRLLVLVGLALAALLILLAVGAAGNGSWSATVLASLLCLSALVAVQRIIRERARR
jgi:hypothetical protein